MLSVSEVCRLMGVSRKRLYYYDHIGLLRPSRRSGPQKAKQYSQKAVERLQLILQYQEAGLKLTEIRELIDASGESRLIILQKTRERLTEEECVIQKKIAGIDALMEKECMAEKKSVQNRESVR